MHETPIYMHTYRVLLKYTNVCVDSCSIDQVLNNIFMQLCVITCVLVSTLLALAAAAMVYAQRWNPAPWNRREMQLRRMLDEKNKRERKRKNRRREEEEARLHQDATAWMHESEEATAAGAIKNEHEHIYMCRLQTYI